MIDSAAWLALSGASAGGFVFPGSNVGFSTLAFSGFLLCSLFSLASFSVCGRDDHQKPQQVSQSGEEGRLPHVTDQYDCGVFTA